MGARRYAHRCCILATLLIALALPGAQGLLADPGETTLSLSGDLSGPVDESGAARQLVSVVLLHKSVDEGAEAAFRVRRNDPRGSLQVNVSLGGAAVPSADFVIEGLAGLSLTEGSVHFAEGQTAAIVAVDVTDDIFAEGSESIILTIVEGAGYIAVPGADQAILMIPPNDTVVTVTDDRGEGSLRQAILNANALEGANTISFDSEIGPFAEPQTILLKSDLPDLSGELTIDGRIEGRLWKATGVTLSGGGVRRVFRVAVGGDVTLHGFTIADGHAAQGGGILNEGKLSVEGVTFLANSAVTDGGGLANLGGSATVINSTFAGNQAGGHGGGLANLHGEAVVTNCTFSGNDSADGGGLFSSGKLRLSNSILANSFSAYDCLSVGEWDAASTHNLIVSNDGCGTPVSCTDPQLLPLGRYNGPTSTFPLGGGSPAVNLGNNAAAVNQDGEPLVWDQRGNGDPRFVAGITDIGAFEQQRNAWLVVDTADDTGARACTRHGVPDCSLRGAIMLANASGNKAHIRFDAGVFGEGASLYLHDPLPDIAVEVTLDGGEAAGISIESGGDFPVFTCSPGGVLKIIGIKGPGGAAIPGCEGNHD